MNTKLRTETKDDFEKDFLKLLNNAVFEKTMENVRKHRDIKFPTTDKRRNQLTIEPNYHTTKYFSENLMAIEMKTKSKNEQENAIRCNNRADLLYLTFTLKISIFSEAYIKPS